MLYKRVLAAAAAITISSSVFEADLPSQKAPPVYVPPPPVFTWTGFYVGINGGYGGDRFAYPFRIDGLSGQAAVTSSGFLGGGQIGFNYQWPTTNYVVGLEADADATSIRGQVSASAGFGGLSASAVGGSHINYIGTVRGRLGYALFDRFLPYVTGGFAYGSVTAYGNANIAVPGGGAGVGASQTNTRTGWTVGAGVEYAITNNLTFKTEYLYVNLGQNTLLSGSFAVPGGAIPYYLGQKTDAHIARAGLNWKFDWLAPPIPVVAKY